MKVLAMLPALKQPTFHSNFKKREKKEGWDHNENQTNVVNSVVYHFIGESIDSSSFNPTYKSTPVTFYLLVHKFCSVRVLTI